LSSSFGERLPSAGPSGSRFDRARKRLSHAKAVTFQMAEVAVPPALFTAFLGRIGRLRVAESPG
jgi:hypothetical protein